MKLVYSCEEWNKDTDKIIEMIESKKSSEKIHLIVPMFGGIPIANKLRNRKDYKISLVKMSIYAERDIKAAWIYNNNISEDEELIIIDDIFDSGTTLKETMDLVRKSYPNNKIRVITIFSTEYAPSWLEYLKCKYDEWIVFPWE